MSQEADARMVPRRVALTPSAAAAETPARTAQLDRLALRKQRSLWGNAWRQFRRHHLAMAGLVVIVFLLLATFVGTEVYPRPIDEIDFAYADAAPSWTFPFGNDSLGQDMLARILWGGRVSLSVGILAAAVAILLGTAVGATAGFFGGSTDSILMRTTDMFISLPQLPLLLLISFLYRDSMTEFFDRHFNNGDLGVFFLIVIVIAVLNWMPTARLVRASFLSLKEKEFVEAARSIGATRSTLMFKHILPNVLSPIIVAATLSVGAAIITESALSFAAVPPGGDIYLLSRVIHDWDDEAAGTILRRCHEAMGDRGTLLVVDAVLPDRAVERPAAIRMDLQMLMLLNGRERTAPEFEQLLTAAGFRLTRVIPTDSPTGIAIVEAEPKA